MTPMKWLERLVRGAWFYWISKWGVNLFGRIFYGLRVEGAEKVPREGGLVIASNHFSAWDPPLLGTSIPREVHFMAKKELFERHWSRLLMVGLRAFPVDRKGSDIGAVKGAIQRLKKGLVVAIFVQGTRNKGDVDPLDGASFLALRVGVPLQPTAIWRQGRSFRVRFGDPIESVGRDREAMRKMTQELTAQLGALLPPESGLRSTVPESGGNPISLQTSEEEEAG